ncbi:MAG TPA: nucleotide exchange factor GrpE [Gemmataceae bacterium]|nr:nucleotide exchange factor GrpE [Gemmataceae bacterium]
MSDPPTTDGTEGTVGGGAPAPLTPAAIDAVLADFRGWLLDLANGRREPQTWEGEPPGEPPSPFRGSAGASPSQENGPAPVDLFTLVGQFTALRHEVNLQTKAARAAVEQNAEVLRQLAAPKPADDSEQQRLVAKAVIDIADALALSLRQMERLRESVEPLLADLAEQQGAHAPRSPRPGFFARLFGAKSPAPPSEPQPNPAADKLRQLAAAAADGYALSLRRIERLLPTLELEPLWCTGEVFDPELMEVVEVAGESGQPAGTVVEQLRAGYRWRGKLFRFAQVKVAR